MTKQKSRKSTRNPISNGGPATAPLYMQVMRSLQAGIIKGRHPVGSQLPGERDLAAQLSVSRQTVREALRQLRDAGLISSRHGSGYVVTSAGLNPGYVFSVASLPELLQFRSLTEFEPEKCHVLSADGELALRLGCSVGRRWLHLEGPRRAFPGDTPLSWVNIYIPAAYAGVRQRLGKRTGPIFALVEQTYGERIAKVEQTMRAVDVDEATKARLQMKPHESAALEISRVYKSSTHKVVQVAIALYPAGRFSYSLELNRLRTQRNKI